jgi:Tol biopolymer transport system component
VSRARVIGVAVLLTIPLGGSAGRASTTPPIIFAADRAPTVTGEIYRLDPNGHRVDLSNSPWQDTDPVLSPDAKHVAFVSNRGAHIGVYEVGTDGKGLVALARNVRGNDPQNSDLAWQPHGDRLAAGFPGNNRIAIIGPGRKQIRVPGAWAYGVGGQPWSPDGRALVVWAYHELRVVAPDGRSLWTAPGDTQRVSAWSPQGLLAVLGPRGVSVYDERGDVQYSFHIPTASRTLLSWSPDGDRLAVSYGAKKLEIRSSDGRVELRTTEPGGTMTWADDARLVFGYAGHCFCRIVSLNVRTRRISSGSSRWFDPLSPDRTLAVVTPRAKPGAPYVLGIASPLGGPVKTYAHIPGCYGDGNWLPAATSLQFVGHTRAVVYQSGNSCDAPFANLYAVAPDDGHITRLTDAQAQQTQPAVSPDASETAYVSARANGLGCKGCSDGVRIVSAGGVAVRTLTDPEDCTFDDSPTWSPDGSTILFAETGCDTPPELYTIPTAGGTGHDLGIAASAPAWGPKRIAYVVGDPHGDIWTANPDGTDPVEVAPDGRKPTWSSDGRLAYLSGSHATTAVVGSSRVTLPFASVASLAWSPDGTGFVLVARTKNAPAYDIYTMRTDGTGLVRLTRNYGVLGASW